MRPSASASSARWLVLPLALGLAAAGGACGSAGGSNTSGTSGTSGTSISSGAAAAASRPPTLKLGDQVPDLLFRNQDDRPVRLSEFRGQVVVVTFLYTRCPFPDYCPRLMNQLAGVRRVLARDRAVWDQIRLIGVSFDPLHDTPDALRAYGQRAMGERPFEHLDLVTGSQPAVDQLAAAFGLAYREEGGQIAHTMATALVDRDGRVANVLEGNNWNPEDVAAAVRELTAVRRADLQVRRGSKQ